MTLLVFDGFDDSLQSTDLSEIDIWQATGSVGFNTVSRFGLSGRKARISSDYAIGHNFIIDQAGNNLFIGFVFQTQEANRTSYDVLSLCEGTIRDSAVQWMLTVEDNYFKIYRGDKTTLLATGTHFLPAETNFYIQIKSLVHNSTGVFELKIGSTITEFSLTSQDTQQQSTDSVQRIQFGYQSGWFDYAFIDDCYICNDVGSAPYNTYLGIMRSTRVYPTGDNSVQWTRSSGSTNYTLVDDTSTPITSNHVKSSTTTDKDIYDVTNMPIDNSSILAVRLETHMSKTGVDLIIMKQGVKSTTTEQFGSDSNMPNDYLYLVDEFLTSDGSTTAWTETEINSMRIMIENVT